jgi:DNA-binding XRE family transcriptional regulator
MEQPNRNHRVPGGTQTRLEELRVNAGLSQKRLSRLVDLDLTTINRLEYRMVLPSAPAGCRLADFFGVQIDELFRSDGIAR